MITKETCFKIWTCWSQIEEGENLLIAMAKEKESRDKLKENASLRDIAWNTDKALEMHIPGNSSGSYSIMGVPFAMGAQIVEAHIQAQKDKLLELEALARIELNNINNQPALGTVYGTNTPVYLTKDGKVSLTPQTES